MAVTVNKEFEVEVEKLILGPTDVLVVKSWDIDVVTVQALREKFNRQVLGISPDDEVFTMSVTPKTVIVFKGEYMASLNQETRDDVVRHVREKTGCKAVLFLSSDVAVETREVTMGWHCDGCGQPMPPDTSTDGAHHTQSPICGRIVRDEE